MHPNRLTAWLPVALAALTIGCADTAAPPQTDGSATAGPAATAPRSIVEIAASDDRFETLVAALEQTGLASTLAQPGPFTVFAPTDEAFALLPDGLVAGLSDATLTEILLYHVVQGDVRASDVVTLDSADTEQGSAITIQVVDGTVVLDGRVQVTTTDIVADNGVIHVIDAVLLPGDFPGTVAEALNASPRFTTLFDAVGTAGLAGTLSGSGPFTVLAPTNDAFDRLPAGLVAGLGTTELADILLYHVISGDVRAATVVTLSEADTVEGTPLGIQVDDSTVVLDGRVQVTFTDIAAANGVIHVLDSVLVPGDYPGTVVDLLAASPRFDTLVGAVSGEGLAGTLAGDNAGSGFTVFAPTNAAFDRLPPTLVGDLVADGLLSTVLLYHVLGSQVDASGAIGAAGSAVPTLATGPADPASQFAVAVDVDADHDLFLDGRTQVTAVDLRASNGVVHVLDSVLVPGGDFPGTLVEALVAYPRFDSLVAAVVGEGLVGAVSDVTVFAPTNDAFATVDIGARALANVLAYHLLPAPKRAADLSGVERTVLGDILTIDFSHGVVVNGSSNVIRADIAASDGVIHVIDEVLLNVH